EGVIVDSKPVPSLESIELALKEHFTGAILQAPPQYSAVHVDGVRAYKLAREGTSVEMQERPVVIHATKILDWQPPLLKISVTCSKGTYIRSFARDLGHAVGSCASLTLLERTSIGPFLSEEAVDTENTAALMHMATQSQQLLLRVPGLANMILGNEAIEGLRHGNLPRPTSIVHSTAKLGDHYANLLDIAGNLLAVVALDDNMLPMKVLALPCAEEAV
ncbi:MAG: tRNA pseudouridine(55) synthase TruB, partial [Spirochaetae bacterium HGW-Spirochaetae-8]